LPKEFLELAEYYNVALVGGDMTRGPLSITVSVKGSVPAGRALLRSGAKAGDGVYVTGTLGDAALALSHLLAKRTLNENQLAAVLPRLDHPHPRILAGQARAGGSALDLSDGLSSDLGHILKASGVRAQIDLDLLPLAGAAGCGAEQDAWQLALAGGDDYELCFTVPEEHRGALDTALANSASSLPASAASWPASRASTICGTNKRSRWT
jgi:thiamine-monophosphate kinase